MAGRFQPTFSISNRMTAGLTRIERARGFLDAAKLSDDWLATMRSRAFLLEAHHTTHIEGTRLTLDQAELAALCPGVNRRTLQRDLRVLVQHGVAKTVGAVRAVRYTLKINRL